MIIIKFEKKTALEKLLLLTFEEIPPKSCRAALAPDLDNYCNKHHLSANSATCFEYMTKNDIYVYFTHCLHAPQETALFGMSNFVQIICSPNC